MFFSDVDKNGVVDVAQGGNANELLQQEHYYPFGMGIRGEWKFVQPQVGGVNPYLYNGKELNDDYGLNWNDYGARWYDASIARWNGVDPLAEDYINLSPYNYVANNPIILIDPDGRQIGDGKDLFNQFKKDVASNLARVNQQIANKESRIEKLKSKGKDKQAAILEENLKKDQANKEVFLTTQSELGELENSDQVYNLYTNSRDVADNAAGNIQYNTKTGAVNVNVAGMYNTGTFAHELKHAFQFEKGALSFSSDGKAGGDLYDLQDEVDAYARGHTFGFPDNPSLDKIKKKYSGIKDRLTQRTLSSPTQPNLSISGTYDVQLRDNNKRRLKANKPIYNYYIGWKKDLQ